VIGIDTDVLGIYHIFTGDPRYPAVRSFILKSEAFPRGVAIFSLLELCGLMATAKQPEEARTLFKEYLASETIAILYPRVEFELPERFWACLSAELLRMMERRMRLGDAAILWTIESNVCEVLVTWNTKHYSGKTSIKVQTPEEWLLERGQMLQQKAKG